MRDNYLKGLAEAMIPFLMPYLENKIHDELENYSPNATTDEQQELLTKNQVMKKFQISAMSLWRMEQDGRLIPVRMGRKVFYRTKDVEKIFI